ncbi:DUF998 domain-containing protein [Thermoclostridium caenicola]|mgnify:FL=1|uniref:DUF998 domain-containing protein n=1 Tax=Thermoclostridium caenicola TaxID=659425 RepID=A0A1M6CPV8_9FIRM|nr:DUF998 domain-containing protein [Thermoclostridium caenicola]SHI63026.1 Protein of unknown function [Thermoclostridium caenicola]HOP71642.1 DUF998 domain-containing protein [Thermoclostridium caenicola]
MTDRIVRIFEATNFGFLLLLIAAIGDVVIPFALAPFYPKYNHLTMVMSLLGHRNSPVHILYNFWLIAAGIMFILGGVNLYAVYFPVSEMLSKALLLCIIIYAVGGCILSGIFPVGETKELKTLSEKIHGFGAVIGFLALLFAPLFTGILSMRLNQAVCGVISFVFFGLALLFFALFIMGDKPGFDGTVVSYEGLWQRLSLICMYAPIIMVSAYNTAIK